MTGPDFLCVGAQKGGTQWLYDQLQHHPDFWMPPIKELHYFDGRRVRAAKAAALYAEAVAGLEATNRDRVLNADRVLESRDLEFLKAFADLLDARALGTPTRLLLAGSSLVRRLFPAYGRVHNEVIWPALRSRGRLDIEGYRRLFAWKGTRRSGDITPGYSTLGAGTIRRIVEAFPGVKVVFLARDPVQRFWSAVAMHVRHGQRTWPADARALERLVREARHASRSYQTRIVARWRRFVPVRDFGLFLFDDLLADPGDLRRRVLTFLGGDPDEPSGNLPPGFNRKARGAKPPLSPEFRRVLGRLMADELKASAAEFGGAAAGWPARYGL
jgi:hypothetical protein